jgi:hypothetical protein
MFLVSLLHASEMGVNEYVKDYFSKIKNEAPDSDIDNAFMEVFYDFKTHVPKSLQPEVIAGMLDIAYSDKSPQRPVVIYHLFNYMYRLGYTEFNSNFHKHLQELAKDHFWIMRRDALKALGALSHKNEQDRITLLNAINDPMDEVRVEAVSSLEDQPDARAILEKYVNAHKGDPTYRSSTLSAWSSLLQIYEKM